MNKTISFLSSLTMTVFSGLLLGASLYSLFFDMNFLVDPAWGTIFISGLPILYIALRKLFFERKISSALLITIAMFAAIYIGEIFAAGEVVFIMAIGELLEGATIKRAKKGLKNLLELKPKEARKIILLNEETQEEMMEISSIEKGDIVRVLPGERIPVDGKIKHGNSSVDQSIITGESLPIEKNIDDFVFAGTINQLGSLDIEVTEVGESSSLEKLIRLVQEAEEKQAPVERVADLWATRLVPIALLIAVITYFLTKDLTRAVTVLVVFCPCAFVLAAPTSVMAAIGQATKHGVLIKSGEALEKMESVDTIAFDKTGTLTLGNLIVNEVFPFSSVNRNDFLSKIASLEKRSEHPIGKAIFKYAKKENIILFDVEDFTSLPGNGLSANYLDKKLFAGNYQYLKKYGILLEKEEKKIFKKKTKEGKILVFLVEDKVCLGMVALSDEIRPKATSVVSDLQSMGLETILLTGDQSETADFFAKQVGIQKVYSELLPQDKMKQVERLQYLGKNVCMIGDGINDAPVLKIADVGISMAEMGTDIAVEASDIGFLSNQLDRVIYLKKLAAATIKNIRFNIILSMIINVVAILLSILGFLTPVTGALVHNLGSVIVVLNAALLYDRKFNW